MRGALTLIEMIFTMVIVGLVFMVVPKIIFVTNRSFETVIKEDALFNALSLMGIVTELPWDENNTKYDTILATESAQAAYLCSESTGFYRVGGFKGARNCIESVSAAASPIGREDSLYNDIDDYNGYSVTTNTPNGAKYELNVSVRYLSEPAAASSLVDLSALGSAAGTSNIKEINVTVTYAESKRPFVSSIYYHSANIGQIHINRRAWR